MANSWRERNVDDGGKERGRGEKTRTDVGRVGGEILRSSGLSLLCSPTGWRRVTHVTALSYSGHTSLAQNSDLTRLALSSIRQGAIQSGIQVPSRPEAPDRHTANNGERMMTAIAAALVTQNMGKLSRPISNYKRYRSTKSGGSLIYMFPSLSPPHPLCVLRTMSTQGSSLQPGRQVPASGVAPAEHTVSTQLTAGTVPGTYLCGDRIAFGHGGKAALRANTDPVY